MVKPEDMANISYTSGTTADPKALCSRIETTQQMLNKHSALLIFLNTIALLWFCPGITLLLIQQLSMLLCTAVPL